MRPRIHWTHDQNEGSIMIRKSLKQLATRRNTVRELTHLDDRTLDDLGITRGDIQDLAHNPARSIF